MNRGNLPILAIASIAISFIGNTRSHADRVTVLDDGNKRVTIEGNVLSEDATGEILLEGRDGQHHFLQARDVLERQRSEQTVRPYTRRQLQAALAKELGPRFKFLRTNNYLVCYSCSIEYARQAGTLLERAYTAFTNHFRRHGGFRLSDPKFRLVAVVCGSRSEFVDLVEEHSGSAPKSYVGVYFHNSNRIYMYDTTDGKAAVGLRPIAPTDTRQRQRQAFYFQEQNTSIIVHEAVHQIAFNTGFHKRNGSNPVWVTEGLAMYFESPDMNAQGGWRGVGDVNRVRLEHFRKMFPERMIPLTELILDDQLFRRGDSVNDAYAQAWAFTYFLAKSKTKSYVSYLKILHERDALEAYPPEERLADFRKAFGKSPEKLELEFKRYISRVVPR